jgi:glycosyltransferase involved in cell wall biosynthesis
MNIWLLTGEYPPDYGGGISTYSYHTVQMLCQRGHRLTVFTPAEALPGSWKVEDQSDRLRVIRFGADQSPQSSVLGTYVRSSYNAAQVLAGFARKEGQPDVLEVQDYLGLPYFTLQRRWLLDDALEKLPVLVTSHTPLYVCQRYDQAPAYRFPGYWVGEMERFSMIAANEVVFPSDCLRKEIVKELPQIRKFSRVIANPYRAEGHDLDDNRNPDRKGFLFTAKIQRLKGIEPLLTSFSQLWDAGLNEPLYLIGDDWYDELNRRLMSEFLRGKYIKYIKANLLYWDGKQPPQVVKQKLNRVRAMILPSLFENYPYAVLEAMAAGCPAIVSDSGGHAEMIEDGSSGLIFSHDKPGDLKEKIQALLKLSPAEYRQMAAAARARVAKVSGYEVIAPQKEEVLGKVSDGRLTRTHFPFLRGPQKIYEIPKSPPLAGRKGLLSIVIPFYNLGDYLEDTLKSFTALEHTPSEIIVVDDGSTAQKSLETLHALQAQYHFRLERTKNQGLAATRNAGANLAKGEFLAFLDADDCMDARFYNQAVNILCKYENISFVGCWAEYFGETKGYWPTWTPEPPYALVHNPINTSALLFRRADFLRYGLNDPSFNLVMEDYDCLLSMLENGCRGVAIPAPYFKYRVRAASMFHDTTDNVKILTQQRLIGKHQSFYRQYAEEIIGLINTNGPAYFYDNPSLYYPAIGFLQNPGSSSGETSSNSVRKKLYYAIRAVLHKPYGQLRKTFPTLERIRLKLRNRMLN